MQKNNILFFTLFIILYTYLPLISSYNRNELCNREISLEQRGKNAKEKIVNRSDAKHYLINISSGDLVYPNPIIHHIFTENIINFSDKKIFKYLLEQKEIVRYDGLFSTEVASPKKLFHALPLVYICLNTHLSDIDFRAFKKNFLTLECCYKAISKKIRQVIPRPIKSIIINKTFSGHQKIKDIITGLKSPCLPFAKDPKQLLTPYQYFNALNIQLEVFDSELWENDPRRLLVKIDEIFSKIK